MEAPRGELQSLASGCELAAGNALEIRGVHEWLSLGDADG